MFVWGHPLRDSRGARDFLGDIGEQRRDRGFTFCRFHENFRCDREQCFLGARGDYFIGVVGENAENFRAVDGREMRARGADGDFSFARRSAVAQLVEDFRAESFHRMPASNSSLSGLLYRRFWARRGTALLRRSIPATPRWSRRLAGKRQWRLAGEQRSGSWTCLWRGR